MAHLSPSLSTSPFPTGVTNRHSQQAKGSFLLVTHCVNQVNWEARGGGRGRRERDGVPSQSGCQNPVYLWWSLLPPISVPWLIAPSEKSAGPKPKSVKTSACPRRTPATRMALLQEPRWPCTSMGGWGVWCTALRNFASINVHALAPPTKSAPSY